MKSFASLFAAFLLCTPTKSFRPTSQVISRPSKLDALPTLPAVAASCVLPTCLGFFKIEYGVGYAYGASVALVAGQVLLKNQFSWHAAALVFYGVRLCLYLAYRNFTIPQFRDRVDPATSNRLTRLPFVLGCSLLYGCLTAPLFAGLQAPRWCEIMTWVGFSIAALGDIQKSWSKAQFGDDHLVKSGMFRFLRHPNYTGEIIGWTGNALAGLLAKPIINPDLLWWNRVAIGFGWMGIGFVLVAAATGLETKQRETYGEREDYQQWLRTSWSGPTK